MALYSSPSRRYGITIGAVSVQFIGGSQAAIVFVPVWAFGVLGSFLWRQKRSFAFLRTWGEWPVIQLYLGAYSVGLAIVIVWTLRAKGFKSRNT